MNPNAGSDDARRRPVPNPPADRVEQLEENHTALVRLLMDLSVLPHVVEEPARVSPATMVTSDGATLACAAGAPCLALGAAGT